MEIEQRYETFGRDISFEDISDVRSGILSQSTFFNIHALRTVMTELTFDWLCNRDILVYFRNIAGNINPAKPVDKTRKWWTSFQGFSSVLGKEFPAGLEMEYWYGPSGKEISSSEFHEKRKPYQAFVKLFANAIQGFSCFVGEHREGIRFSSNRTNYHTIKSGEALIHDNNTLWAGTPDVFLNSAQILCNAFDRMGREGYATNVFGHNDERCEIRIIVPERGAMVGSLYKGDSVTFFVKNSELERIVEKHNARRQECSKLLER